MANVYEGYRNKLKNKYFGLLRERENYMVYYVSLKKMENGKNS